MDSEASSSSVKPKAFLVFSNKPPQDARIFDLRPSDIEEIRAQTEELIPVLPDEWGLTSTNQDGVCKYCQLMLHPDAPNAAKHQPSIQSLITSGQTCQPCRWLEISIVRGSPDVARRFSEGDPTLCGPSSTANEITVLLSKDSKYTKIVAVVGPQGDFADKGVALVYSTPSRLGDLASRRFWEPYNSRPDSQPHERLRILKSWLSECSSHENCPANRDTVLPTRVLDLTGSQAVPSSLEDVKIKLRETSEGETGSYIALSYCWGADPKHHFKTTQQTLEQYKSGIDFQSLPLTQREAILVALYLGIRYVWIDGACIIQDSPRDWEVEAAKMSSVYSNSLLTLAATSSSSPEDGLLNPFQAAECVSIQDESVMLRMDTSKTIDDPSEPLNTRGWTLQESVLSDKLVCFGKEQWLWKCSSRYTTEDGLIDRPPRRSESLNQWAGIVQRGPDDGDRTYFDHWYRLVSDFSQRALTYQSDKLKAMAGLADTFARKIGCQYVAGLWVEDLVVGLMWYASVRGVTRHPGSIPSWSWASVEGAVLVPRPEQKMVPQLKLLNVEQRWEGVPLSSNLEISHLTVTGRMVQATLGQCSDHPRPRVHLIAAPESEETVGEGLLDNRFAIEQEISTVWCLLLATMPDVRGELQHHVLILIPAQNEGGGDTADAYRRLGIGFIWEISKFIDSKREGNVVFTEESVAKVVLV